LLLFVLLCPICLNKKKHLEPEWLQTFLYMINPPTVYCGTNKTLLLCLLLLLFLLLRLLLFLLLLRLLLLFLHLPPQLLLQAVFFLTLLEKTLLK